MDLAEVTEESYLDIFNAQYIHEKELIEIEFPYAGNDKEVWTQIVHQRTLLNVARALKTLYGVVDRSLVYALEQIEGAKAYLLDECGTLESWMADKMSSSMDKGFIYQTAFVVTTVIPFLKQLGMAEYTTLMTDGSSWANLRSCIPVIRAAVNQGFESFVAAEAAVTQLKDEESKLKRHLDIYPDDKVAKEQLAALEIEIETEEKRLAFIEDSNNERLKKIFETLISNLDNTISPVMARANVEDSLAGNTTIYGSYYLVEDGRYATLSVTVPYSMFVSIENRLRGMVSFTITDKERNDE